MENLEGEIKIDSQRSLRKAAKKKKKQLEEDKKKIQKIKQTHGARPVAQGVRAPCS